ncbi:MAG: hypothetical protein DYG89_48120 [Caldilinea sp. CFX5]|nr:hypothetical protein [Caldilinea sp. CFX5]
MWKDQELHKLFRSRLPIADLPTAFAERLTHTILEEVAILRQTNLLHDDATTDHLAEGLPCKPAPKPTARLLVKSPCLL